MNNPIFSFVAVLVLSLGTVGIAHAGTLESCKAECRKEDAHAQMSCRNDCQAIYGASVDSGWIEHDTQIAQPTGHGGFGGGGSNQQADVSCDAEGCPPIGNTRSRASSNQYPTQFADIRIGDPQPICGTDPWACFNGTDDSPDIRNVDIGIFGVFADGSGY